MNKPIGDKSREEVVNKITGKDNNSLIDIYSSFSEIYFNIYDAKADLKVFKLESVAKKVNQIKPDDLDTVINILESLIIKKFVCHCGSKYMTYEAKDRCEYTHER